MNEQRPNTATKQPVAEKDTKSAAHGDKLEGAVESASKAKGDGARTAEELKGDEVME